jgi:ankyrin repeat protein
MIKQQPPPPTQASPAPESADPDPDPDPAPDYNLDLIRACKSSSLSAATAALASGADINTLGMWSSTPLLIACQYGCAEIALHLLSEGARVDVINEKGVGALTHACVEGLHDVVTAILDHHPDTTNNGEMGKVYVSAIDENAICGPLRGAILGGHHQIVQTLLARGLLISSADVPGDDMGAALMCCRLNDGNILDLMMPSLKIADLSKALHLGASAIPREGAKDVLPLLIAYAKQEDEARLQLALSDQANGGMTPLHLLCSATPMNLVRIAVLLREIDFQNAEAINAKCGKKGWTAVMYLVASNSLSADGGQVLDLLKLFHARGADFSCADKHKRSATTLSKKNRKKVGDAGFNFCESASAEAAAAAPPANHKEEETREEEIALPGAM